MLEKICTDLETSKRLKELGFEAETDFYWTITTIDEWNKNQWNIIYFKDRGMAKYEPTVPAYTLEQILNELPRNIMISQIVYDLSIDNYDIGYHNTLFKKTYIQFSKQNNLATAAAKLWIKLKEDKII
jgi:hypothetical protein